MTKIIVHVPGANEQEAVAPAFINGQKVEYPINKAFDASDELLAVLMDSSLKVEKLPEGGSSEASAETDEGGAEDRGGASAAALYDVENSTVAPIEPDATLDVTQQAMPAPTVETAESTFDADAIIDGTIDDVTARLEGLTLEQLAAVEAAEADREVPRKGVAKAIADAKAAQA